MDKPWKVVFAFVGIFIAGAVFGEFFSLRLGGRILRMERPELHGGGSGPQNPQEAGQPRPPAPMAAAWQAPQLMRRFTERLDLTPEQKEQIRPVIQRAADDFRRQTATNLREHAIIMQRLQEDIAKVLTPEQQARLEKMEQRQHELLGRGERAGGPGGRANREGFRSGEKASPGGDKAPPNGSESKAPSSTASPATAPTPPPAPSVPSVDGEKK